MPPSGTLREAEISQVTPYLAVITSHATTAMMTPFNCPTSGYAQQPQQGDSAGSSYQQDHYGGPVRQAQQNPGAYRTHPY